MSGYVTVVDPGVRRLARLAADLASRGQLRNYVSGFRLTSTWHHRLTSLPVIGGLAARRQLPSDLPPRLVYTTAVFEDAARAVASRAPGSLRAAGTELARHSVYRRNRLIARRAGSLASGSRVVIAYHGAALEALQASQRTGGIGFLDCPIAHHRYSQSLLSEEARRRAQFAGSLQFHHWPRSVERRLDRECQIADYLLASSTFVKETFVGAGVPESKIIVTPYGVDSTSFYPGESIGSSRFRVLFVGQVTQRKGISYLLEAYKAFHRPGTELQIVGHMIGSFEPIGQYSSLINHVEHIHHRAIPAVYRDSSVFVLPSLIEGMALVVLEAMASGLPVIVTENTGVVDVVRDGIDGFFVPIRDSQAIEERLDLLYNDQNLRRFMSRNARERALEFTWERYHHTVAKAIHDPLGATQCRQKEGQNGSTAGGK